MIRMGARLAIGMGVLAAVNFAVRTATATPSVRLVYVRGAGTAQCPEEVDLHRGVAERLGYDPFFSFANRTIVAQIDAAPEGGYRGRVQVMDETGRVIGERTLRSKNRDCAEMVRALALNLSITVDDLAVDVPSPPEVRAKPQPVAEEKAPTLPEEPAARTQPESPASPSPKSEPTPSLEHSKTHLQASLGVMGSLNTAPGIAGGVSAGFGLRWRSFEVGLEGRADLPASGTISSGSRVASSLLVGTTTACWLRLPILLCGEGSFGSIAGGGADIAHPRSGAGIVVSAGARVGLELPLAPGIGLYGRAFVEGAYVLVRPTIQIDGRDAFSPGPLVGALGAAMVVRF